MKPQETLSQRMKRWSWDLNSSYAAPRLQRALLVLLEKQAQGTLSDCAGILYYLRQ